MTQELITISPIDGREVVRRPYASEDVYKRQHPISTPRRIRRRGADGSWRTEMQWTAEHPAANHKGKYR